jgi:two-component system, OmpR family, alkaline phosphatase synthesis response regulator PhoP
MKKILVIEDEKSVRNNILRMLKAEGFQALGAENGIVGVKLAQAELPEIIICDVMMPELDGFGVLKELQKNPETALIPFIFLTAKAERSDLRQGLELGADDYLTKPFEFDELLRAINARFNKQKLQQQKIDCLREELIRFRQVVEAKDNLFTNLDQELRRPLSNIVMALKMLETDAPTESRERYLQILQSEFAREISLLNQMSQLQQLLTPENVTLLGKFNFLKK